MCRADLALVVAHVDAYDAALVHMWRQLERLFRSRTRVVSPATVESFGSRPAPVVEGYEQ